MRTVTVAQSPVAVLVAWPPWGSMSLTRLFSAIREYFHFRRVQYVDSLMETILPIARTLTGFFFKRAATPLFDLTVMAPGWCHTSYTFSKHMQALSEYILIFARNFRMYSRICLPDSGCEILDAAALQQILPL